jgi:hypothetical protein
MPSRRRELSLDATAQHALVPTLRVGMHSSTLRVKSRFAMPIPGRRAATTAFPRGAWERGYRCLRRRLGVAKRGGVERELSRRPFRIFVYPSSFTSPRTSAFCHPRSVICHLSSVICHLSSVIFHQSSVICHLRSVISAETPASSARVQCDRHRRADVPDRRRSR